MFKELTQNELCWQRIVKSTAKNRSPQNWKLTQIQNHKLNFRKIVSHKFLKWITIIFIFRFNFISQQKRGYFTWSSEAGKDGHSLSGNSKNSGPSTHEKFFSYFLGKLDLSPHLTGLISWGNISNFWRTKTHEFQQDGSPRKRKNNGYCCV